MKAQHDTVPEQKSCFQVSKLDLEVYVKTKKVGNISDSKLSHTETTHSGSLLRSIYRGAFVGD